MLKLCCRVVRRARARVCVARARALSPSLPPPHLSLSVCECLSVRAWLHLRVLVRGIGMPFVQLSLCVSHHTFVRKRRRGKGGRAPLARACSLALYSINGRVDDDANMLQAHNLPSNPTPFWN